MMLPGAATRSKGCGKKMSGGLRAEVGLDRVDGQVHMGQPPGGGVGFLAVDGDVASPRVRAPAHLGAFAGGARRLRLA